MAVKYNPKAIEKKWQQYWQKHKTFTASDTSKKPKKFVLVEFPYPSGAGLHMGHLRSYTAGDAYSRYLRMQGYEVLYPMGWDAFGLPAENFAIKTGKHPRTFTYQNIENFRKEINSLGYSFDWSREVDTTDPGYYTWTQWIFLQFFKKGLAFEAVGEINWCPKDKTGLANEEVINGRCDRCGTIVEKKQMRQWYLRITQYAEKLLKGLEKLDWPESVKLQQANWIGKSEGAEISFSLARGDAKRETITVFTTRPDTIFGATYLVIAPEHPLLQNQKQDIKNAAEVQSYINKAKVKQEEERTAEKKEKTGVELKGITAINPATGKEIPVWVADYVLGNYGTGAIMAVPAHDTRDFEFAKKYKLPIVQVITTTAKTAKLLAAEPGHGLLINSGEFTGKQSADVQIAMAKMYGKVSLRYKMRDWVFSRQRYWGEPIPLIHCDTCGTVPVPEKDLPVLLPNIKKFEPTGTGESPLASVVSWVNVKCPKCKGAAKRETNTMPQWAGSSWYWLRYTDPKNKKEFASKKKLQRWQPVDVYFGGMEHTTLHLLYSRFWNQFLYDQKLVTASEPYTKRVPHGIILASDGEKMSKSRGNVVGPEPFVKKYGADTTRMYEMFLGPHEAQVSWKAEGIVGLSRFLEKIWKWIPNKDLEEAKEVKPALHKLIKKVTEDIEHFRFNTAISALMEFHKNIEANSRESKRIFVQLLYPFAPHIAEELYTTYLGGIGSLQNQAWPKFDPKLVVAQEVTIVVQINGKMRARLQVPAGSTQAFVLARVKEIEQIKNTLMPVRVLKTIFVPNRLLNFVIA